MPKIQYIEKTISADKHKVIQVANAILDDYANQGFQLTLRQLYYQFIAKDLFANTEKNYKYLGDVISDGRLLGLIDWNAIVDRTRNVRSLQHWTTPAHAIRSVARGFHIDLWKGQPYRPEVWIEKDALVGIIEGVCSAMDVPYFSCRGFTSQSEMWAGAMRLKEHFKAGQVPYILHLGDHDPSGIDMSRDIKDRLRLFMGPGWKFKRLALNFDQVEKYKPPPNYAKIKDPRAKKYIQQFGESSWELDALSPKVIVGLIQKKLESIRDDGKWNDQVAILERHRRLLKHTSERWAEVETILEQ